MGTTSAPQSGGVLVPPSIPNQTDYDSFSGPVITGPAARFYSVVSNTCVGEVVGPVTCTINVVFSPTVVPPAGQTENATLTFNYNACFPGPTSCTPITGSYSLVGTVTGSTTASSSAQIQITPTQPVLLQPGNYGSELAIDNSGNLFASINNTVVEFNPTQVYTPNSTPTVIAGNGGPGGTGDGGGPLNAGINPLGITVMGGHVFVVDNGSAVVREFDPGGALINLYAGAYNMVCRGIDQTYHVGLTVQGTGCYNYNAGSPPAIPPTIGLFNPTSLTNDGLNVYINDAGSDTITLKTPQNNFTAVAGYAGTPYIFEGYLTNELYPGYSGDGGPGESAQINNPGGMAVGPNGNLYFADEGNNLIRAVDLSTSISSFIGQPPGNTGSYPVGLGDGPASEATLSNPLSVTFDLQGDMYIFDQSGYALRKVQINNYSVPGNINTLYSLSSATYPPPPPVDSGTPVIDSTGEILVSPYTNLASGRYFNPLPTPGIYEILGSGLLNFPQVGIGTPTVLTATITNPGTAALQILGTSIDGPNNADFTITSTASSCGSSVGSNSSCTITVTFNPTSQYTATTRTATLHLSTNVGSGTQVIALSGTTYALPTLTTSTTVRTFTPYYDWPQPSTAVVAVTAGSGVPPYTFTGNIASFPGTWYLYSGATSAMIEGIPTQVGSFPYSITVTDSVGGTATVSGTVTVQQAPSELTLSAQQTSIAAGTAVSVTGTVNASAPPEATGVYLPSGNVQFQLDNNPAVFEPIPVAFPSSEPTSPYSFNIDILYHTLTGTYAGDTNYLAAAFPQTLTFNGNRPQTITFHGGLTAPSGSQISLTAFASSGLPVSYAVTSGPGFIDTYDVRLVLTGTGTVQVTASQAGNSSFAPATPVTATFTSN